MRQNFVLHAIGALIAGAFALVYYQSVEPVELASVTKLRISPAAETIARGDLLTPDMLEAVTIPVTTSGGGVSAADLAWAIDDTAAVRAALTGRAFTQAVQPGAFLEERFFFEDRVGDLLARIKPGNRAFSIEVPGGTSIEHFIAPGSRVDVVGLVETGRDTAEAQVLLEDVEIMAVGPVTTLEEFRREGEARYNSVTLQAPPELVSDFLERQARLEGTLSLVLRGPALTAEAGQ